MDLHFFSNKNIFAIENFMIMASYLNCDFKPTPMIFGEEGKNFLESTVHVKKESKHKLAEMEKAYKQFNQAMQRGKND